MMNFNDMSENSLRSQIRDTLNALAASANDYQMDTADVVEHITSTLPYLEYLCKTALNVSVLERPKSMQDLVATAEDIVLQNLGGHYMDTMNVQKEHDSDVEGILSSMAEETFQKAYYKSVSDSHFEYALVSLTNGEPVLDEIETEDETVVEEPVLDEIETEDETVVEEPVLDEIETEEETAVEEHINRRTFLGGLFKKRERKTVGDLMGDDFDDDRFTFFIDTELVVV